jgi:hypothetical protein
MDTNLSRQITLAVFLVAVSTLADREGSTASSPPPQVHHYVLHDGSYLIDDCPACGRPTFQDPMRGSFDLRLLGQGPLFTEYAVEHIDFNAQSGSGRQYRIRGEGTYRIGGEVALVQNMFLTVHIDDGVSNKLCYFTNANIFLERLWPMIGITLEQTNGTLAQQYELHLDAAPLRDIWFSTLAGMTSSKTMPPTNYVRSGDLISYEGRIVKRILELTERLDLIALTHALDLDAVDVLPGGEIAFSIERDVSSETLGQLHHGDLLSNRGAVIRTNQQLTALFGLAAPAPDSGLDAVQVLDDGQIYFSIQTNISSAKGMLRAGDMLSDRGAIVRRNHELVARFLPANTNIDYGLDALYVWPSGEIWFSTEQGFTDEGMQTYGHGDLLSDQGYVVFRNLELVGAFAPLEDLSDFGLDALFIVTDVTPSASAPRFISIVTDAKKGTVDLEWMGGGRVWQVLGSTNLPANFTPRSPIIPDTFFQDSLSESNRALFYLLQQW